MAYFRFEAALNSLSYALLVIFRDFNSRSLRISASDREVSPFWADESLLPKGVRFKKRVNNDEPRDCAEFDEQKFKENAATEADASHGAPYACRPTGIGARLSVESCEQRPQYIEPVY